MRWSILLTFILCGCIITPKVEKNYDSNCDVFKKKVALQSKFIVISCHNKSECSGYLGVSVISGVITGAVSVAIMLVGNTYYAISQNRRCKTPVSEDKIELVN